MAKGMASSQTSSGRSDSSMEGHGSNEVLELEEDSTSGEVSEEYFAQYCDMCSLGPNVHQVIFIPGDEDHFLAKICWFKYTEPGIDQFTPRVFAKRYLREGVGDVLVIATATNQMFLMKYLMTGRSARLTSGWSDFVSAFPLQLVQGDVVGLWVREEDCGTQPLILDATWRCASTWWCM